MLERLLKKRLKVLKKTNLVGQFNNFQMILQLTEFNKFDYPENAIEFRCILKDKLVSLNYFSEFDFPYFNVSLATSVLIITVLIAVSLLPFLGFYKNIPFPSFVQVIMRTRVGRHYNFMYKDIF